MPRLRAYPIVKIILVVVQLAKLSMKKKKERKSYNEHNLFSTKSPHKFSRKKETKDAAASANLSKSLSLWTKKVFSSPFTLCLKKVNSGICNKH